MTSRSTASLATVVGKMFGGSEPAPTPMQATQTASNTSMSTTQTASKAPSASVVTRQTATTSPSARAEANAALLGKSAPGTVRKPPASKNTAGPVKKEATIVDKIVDTITGGGGGTITAADQIKADQIKADTITKLSNEAAVGGTNKLVIGAAVVGALALGYLLLRRK